MLRRSRGAGAAAIAQHKKLKGAEVDPKSQPRSPAEIIGQIKVLISKLMIVVPVILGSFPRHTLAQASGRSSTEPTSTYPLHPVDRISNRVTAAGNFDSSYHQTQFYAPGHDALGLSWDFRVELWLPPNRTEFSWGPYVRTTGSTSDRQVDFENGLLAAPGAGLQAYPFSLDAFRKEGNVIGEILGPLRVFAEYNVIDYYLGADSWRPNRQVRAGLEYYRNLFANDTRRFWWSELYGVLEYQSSNDFALNYNGVIFAQAARAGVRIPNSGVLSWITPYAVLESSVTSHPSLAFENYLRAGVGLRIAPNLMNLPCEFQWVNRLNFYAEYIANLHYFSGDAAPGTPNWDWSVGVSMSIGDFWH